MPSIAKQFNVCILNYTSIWLKAYGDSYHNNSRLAISNVMDWHALKSGIAIRALRPRYIGKSVMDILRLRKIFSKAFTVLGKALGDNLLQP